MNLLIITFLIITRWRVLFNLQWRLIFISWVQCDYLLIVSLWWTWLRIMIKLTFLLLFFIFVLYFLYLLLFLLYFISVLCPTRWFTNIAFNPIVFLHFAKFLLWYFGGWDWFDYNLRRFIATWTGVILLKLICSSRFVLDRCLSIT